MTIELETHAVEKSTYIITASFKDAAGNAVIPDSIRWHLVDKLNHIMNNRTGVVVAVPAASTDIVLSGNDLALMPGETNIGERTLIIEAVYDSTEGSDLPLTGEVNFIIDNLKYLEMKIDVNEKAAIKEYSGVS